MESLVLSSSSPSSTSSTARFPDKNSNFCSLLRNGFPSSLSFPSQNPPFSSRKLVIVAAKKDDGEKKKKLNPRPFVAKPHEGYRFYPEAILGKQKKVKEESQPLPDFADDEEKEVSQALSLKVEERSAFDQMRHYEVVYLIHEKFKEQVETVNLKVQDFLREKKARIWNYSDWGMRKLAYKIQKAKYAHYIVINIEIGASRINDFKNMLDKDERVIRHLVMRRDEAITEDRPPPPELQMDDDEEVFDFVFDEEDDAAEDEDEDEDYDEDEYEGEEEDYEDDEYEYEEYEDEDEDVVETTNISDDDDANVIYMDEDEDEDEDMDTIDEDEDEDENENENEDEDEDELDEMAEVKGRGRRRLKGGGRRKHRGKK